MQGPMVISLAKKGGRIRPSLTLPDEMNITPLVIGKTTEQVVQLLGRLFSLCRRSQEAAARLAFGLPPTDPDAHVAEILRDSLFRLMIGLPRALGKTALPLPADWQTNPVSVRAAVFGPSGHMPVSDTEFRAWLRSDEGLAPLIAALADSFAPGEAASNVLTFRGSLGQPRENSPAMRHVTHPVMIEIEVKNGRGPLWRTVARLLDLEACLDHTLPPPRLIEPGVAEASATRGMYRLGAVVKDERVVSMWRHTPTDDICHPRGSLISALAALPMAKRHLAPLVVECFDPCLPWTLREADHA